MEMLLQDRPIRRVAIIDDKEMARESMSEILFDAGFEPIPQKCIEADYASFIKRIMNEADAAVFDFHLSPGNYARFDGAHAVSTLYDKLFPAVLLTQRQGQGFDTAGIISKRRKIPSFINSADGDVDSIYEGIERCVRELNSEVLPDRQGYRTVVRVEEINQEDAHRKIARVVVPAWNPEASIPLPLDYITGFIGKEITEGTRLFAEVNIGAREFQDLFFDRIELAKGLRDEFSKLIHS